MTDRDGDRQPVIWDGASLFLANCRGKNPVPVQPTHLELVDEKRLAIDWSDGTRRLYRFSELREKCPCATCREKRNAPEKPATSLEVLSPQEAQPLKVTGMKPVGNYAYGISFSDGHDTGIYTFDFLHSLGEEAKNT